MQEHTLETPSKTIVVLKMCQKPRRAAPSHDLGPTSEILAVAPEEPLERHIRSTFLSPWYYGWQTSGSLAFQIPMRVQD